MSDTQPLIPGVRKDIILDPSSELPGFIASELEQQELLNEPTYVDVESHEVQESLSWTKVNLIVGSMSTGVFLAAVDMTIVATLISKIASEFDSLDKLSWIASGYLLSSSTFQPLYGKVSDIFGRRSMLLFANVCFMLGCLICCVAPHVNTLILGRFISGIGGGGLTAMTSITTSDLVPLKNRGIYQGINNIAFASGSGVGSLVGGYFVSHEVIGGWRGAFAFQIPVTLLSTVMIYALLKLPRGSPGLGVHGSNIKKKLKLVDWGGSITLVFALLSFLTLTSNSNDFFTLRSLGLLTVTLIGFLGFIYSELRARFPILPLSFMKIPTVLGVSLSNFFFSISTFNSYFIITLYYTAVMNLSSQQVGYRFAPNFFSIVFGSLGAGYYMKATGRYHKLLLISGALTIFGTLRILTIYPEYPKWAQFLLLVTPGFGVSVIITATLLALIAAVPHEHQAATTSISYLFRSCGSTLGVSIGSTIFQRDLQIQLHDNVMSYLGDEHDKYELLKIIERASHSTEYVNSLAPEFIRDALIKSYDHSCKSSFKFCLVASFFGFASLLLIKEYILHSTLKRK
jgi:MFS family permease